MIQKIILLVIGLMCAVATAQAAPRVVFDEGHGQRFHLDGTEELDLSSLAKILRSRKVEAVVATERFSNTGLKGVQALVLSGPFEELRAEEVTALVDFVEDGGKLAVMLHVAQPMRELLHQLGVDFTNGPIREREGVIDGNPLNFRVARLEYHPVTQGLNGFNVYGAWGLTSTTESAAVIASTSSGAWVDLDGNNRLSEGDSVQSFGVLVAGKYGDGSFLVFGDDAIFQNRFLSGDNAALAGNLAAWLASRIQ